MAVKDVYPLLRIDDTIDSLGGSVVFSMLDLLTNAICCGRPDEDGIHDKTRAFRFVRMPFGPGMLPSVRR